MNSFCFSPSQLLTYFLFPSKMSILCLSTLDLTTPPPQLSLSHYLWLFGLTCLLEAPIYWVGAKGLPSKARMIQILILNLATHPLVTWIFPTLFSTRPSSEYLLASEAFAFSIEILLLRVLYRYPWSKAILVGGLANLFSWWVGVYLD